MAVPSGSTPLISFAKRVLHVRSEWKLLAKDRRLVRSWRELCGCGPARLDWTSAFKICERMCERGDGCKERRKKVRKLHDDGYRSSDCGSGTTRVVVIIKSKSEGGRRVTIYTSGKNIRLVRFSCQCSATNAVRQMLKSNCLTLPRIKGAETHRISILINE